MGVQIGERSTSSQGVGHILSLMQPVFSVTGLLVTGLGLAMLLPAAVDYVIGANEWRAFLASAAFTVFIGLAVHIGFREPRGDEQGGALTIQQTFLMTSFSWFVLPIFGMLPFIFGETQSGLADAFFEAMSGLTTTGATVLDELESLPRGLIMWRAMLQWFGGIGIIVVALAFLPAMRVGGMQFFSVDEVDTLSGIMPRALGMMRSISLIYGVLTLLFAVIYAICGMEPFDAMVHAMTSVATGGYSSKSNSFAAFPPAVQYAAIIFMLVASLPFARYVQLIAGSFRPLLRDSQVQAFLATALALVTALAVYRVSREGMPSEAMIRESAFNGISIFTGTGYSASDYGAWGGFPATLLFAFGLVGGCAGSTCCAIKIFRFQVLLETARVQLMKLRSPNAIFHAQYQGKPLSEEVATSVAGFMFFFAATLIGLAIILSALGLEAITAISGAAMAIGNIGIGLGPEIGPAGNFSTLPSSAKWVLSAGMFLGRLELMSVFVLLSPYFWRR